MALYSFGGKGGAADKVNSRVSVRESVFEADTLLECDVNVNGAKTVRYCFERACSSRANGLVGGGDSSRGLGGALVEKGRRVERIDEIGGFV